MQNVKWYESFFKAIQTCMGSSVIPSYCLCLQVEPFYVTLSLFDIQNGRKISSDFQVDLNHQSVRGMVCSNTSQHVNGEEARSEGQRFIHGVPEAALLYPKQVEMKSKVWWLKLA